jgi:hypothetical protein
MNRVRELQKKRKREREKSACEKEIHGGTTRPHNLVTTGWGRADDINATIKDNGIIETRQEI